MTIRKNKISIIGLGKLGLPLLASFASRGFNVLGVDAKDQVVNAINKGKSPIVEPQLPEFISKFKENIRATKSYQEAIDGTDITFVIVATPTDPRGNFSNIYVESALKSLAKSLKNNGKNYHLFVISSTVAPGSTERKFIPLIEKYSGRKLNIGFGVCYVPDFVALGNVINGFLEPDLVIIGKSDKSAGENIAEIYKKFCKNSPLIAEMSIVNGEIAKMALNNYITLKISFANSLANLCEKIPGGNIDQITEAIGHDKRISPYYLKGGLSFGGTCFPRDTKAFIALSKKYGQTAELMKAVEKVNKFQDSHFLKIVLKNLQGKKERKVSLLGLAFKPQTPVVVESPAVKLIQGLLKKKVEIVVYDPLAMADTRKIFGNKIKYSNSVKNCLSQSSFWIIAAPDREFYRIPDFLSKRDHLIIIDCWRILDKKIFPKNVRYIKWGYYDYS